MDDGEPSTETERELDTEVDRDGEMEVEVEKETVKVGDGEEEGRTWSVEPLLSKNSFSKGTKEHGYWSPTSS